MPQTPSLSHSWLATKAIAKASLALLNPKIWGLSLLPFLIAAVAWAALAWAAWDPASLALREMLSHIDLPAWLFNALPSWLITVAQSSRSVWIPFGLLLFAIPGVLVTALALVGFFGTGIVARGIGAHYGLAPMDKSLAHAGMTLLRSGWHSLWVMLALLLLWVITLPLWLLPGFSFVLPVVLLGWATARLFTHDVLAEFASAQEAAELRREHGKSLLVLGMLASLPTVLPAVVWVGGAFAFVFLPAFAALAVWLYVMMFLACAAVFSHYLLPALKHRRDLIAAAAAQAQQRADEQAALAAQANLTAQQDADAQAIEVEAREVGELPAPSKALGLAP